MNKAELFGKAVSLRSNVAKVLILLGVVCSVLSVEAAEPRIEIPGGISGRMDKLGCVGRITWREEAVINTISLVGNRYEDTNSKNRVLYAQWVAVNAQEAGISITANSERIDVEGKIFPKDQSDVPVSFLEKIQINEQKSRLNLYGSITYTTTSDWTVPAFAFLISIPLSVIGDGAIKVVDAKGMDREIAMHDPLKKTMLDLSSVTIPTANGMLVIDAGEDSSISVADSRAWGEKNLEVRVVKSMPWRERVTLDKGSSMEFRASIEFRTKN